MSIYTSKKVWKFLIQIQLTKSNPKIASEVKVPCLMPIRVKGLLFSCLSSWFWSKDAQFQNEKKSRITVLGNINVTLVPTHRACFHRHNFCILGLASIRKTLEVCPPSQVTQIVQPHHGVKVFLKLIQILKSVYAWTLL